MESATQGGPSPTAIIKANSSNRKGEIGWSGLVHQGGVIREEWLRALDGVTGVRTYAEMATDPIVAAVLHAIEQEMLRVEWLVVPADASNEAMKVAEFFEQCRDDMSHTWRDFLSEAFSMFTFGWSYHEIVYKVRKGEIAGSPGESSKYTDGKWGWRKLPLRSQETLDRWELADDGGIAGMWQQTSMGMSAPALIPIEKGLLFRPKAHKNNPQGHSPLRASFVPWFRKKRIEEVEGIGIERDLAGLPVIGLPAEWFTDYATDSQRAALAEWRTIGEQIRADEQACIVMPLEYDAMGNKKYSLELLSSGGAKQFDTSAVIERYARHIAMVTLADVILIGHESVGSFSLATTKAELFSRGLEGWLDAQAEIINRHAVRRLGELNNIPMALLPSFRPGPVAEVDLTVLGEYITKLSGAGFALFPSGDGELEQYVTQVAGLPWTPGEEKAPPPPSTDKEPEPEPEEDVEEDEELEKRLLDPYGQWD